MLIGIGEHLDMPALERAGEEEPVRTKAGLSDLSRRERDAGVRGAHEDEAAQVRRMLARSPRADRSRAAGRVRARRRSRSGAERSGGIVEPVDEVDAVREQGRLRRRERHDGGRVAVEQEDLEPCRCGAHLVHVRLRRAHTVHRRRWSRLTPSSPLRVVVGAQPGIEVLRMDTIAQ